jgi:DNA-binding MarR family transcriptional regulator
MNEQVETFALFDLFNEIGIIHQLTTTRLEAVLPDGLIAPHFTVLNHLTRVGEGTTPQRMARAFQVPKTSLTHTLQGLEKRGLIEMRRNPEDGRSKTVWLTEAGRSLRADTITKLAAHSRELMDKLDLARLSEIKPVLTELRIILDAARDPDRA